MWLLVLVCCLVGSTLGLPVIDDADGTGPTESNCGYASCRPSKPGMLNVHIVPHTHDDVGWLKTVDQYFYGSKNNIQKAGVQYIIDSVVKELWEDPNRRFVYVESFFFFKWWSRQKEDVKQKVHTLVQQGRLQFAGGAWSMNDEAAAHYQSIIDQFTFGLRLLNDTFGECGRPVVGWQIDPFGHSREFANLLAAMGYDGLFLGRIDFQDKAYRMETKTMEMIWRGDDDIGKSSDILTGVLYNMYQPPPGFCFDILCNDEPLIDEVASPDYNIDERVSEFVKFVTDMAKFYDTNNVILTMGGDFTYQDANIWYRNLDKLIEYTNLRAAKAGLNIELFYSTPQCYLKAIKDSNVTFTTKKDDFFPYASAEHEYWTGYFTSRPTTKFFERETNRYLQMAKQLQVLANLEEHNMFVLNELKSAMGIMQHHDAITGTEKQKVAYDYERILNNAIEDSLLIPRQAFNKYIEEGTDSPILSYVRCPLNESSCYVSENSVQFVVTLYNPLAWDMKEPVRIPVKVGRYQVIAPNGDVIPSQIVEIPQAVMDIPTRKSSATHEIVFIAHLHPVSYKSFFINKVDSMDAALYGKKKKRAVDDYSNSIEERYTKINEYKREEQLDMMLGDDPMIIEQFSGIDYSDFSHRHIRDNEEVGQIFTTTMPDGTEVKFKVKFGYYTTKHSGAYIFAPEGSGPEVLRQNYTQSATGNVVQEITIKSEANASSTIRYYDGLEYIEHDWVVGPIYNKDKGREMVVRYEFDIKNNGVIETDSNGRQMITRNLKVQPPWQISVKEPIAAHYYPIVNKISLHNEDIKVSVLTDRSEGGSSFEEGQLELMLHRRLILDDSKGVGEALNETVLNGFGLVIRGRHRLLLSTVNNANDKIKEKKNVVHLHMQPLVFISNADKLKLENWKKMHNCHSWMGALPDGLHLLSLEPWKDNTLLLRIENLLEKSDTDNSAIQLDLSSVFKTLKLASLRETTLAANSWKPSSSQVDDFKITINAKEIRTFIIAYKHIN